jgi:hypothetical protein
MVYATVCYSLARSCSRSRAKRTLCFDMNARLNEKYRSSPKRNVDQANCGSRSSKYSSITELYLLLHRPKILEITQLDRLLSTSSSPAPGAADDGLLGWAGGSGSGTIFQSPSLSAVTVLELPASASGLCVRESMPCASSLEMRCDRQWFRTSFGCAPGRHLPADVEPAIYMDDACVRTWR